MSKPNDQRPETPRHAEGQHGERTHDAFIDGLHGRHGGSEESEGAPQEENLSAAAGVTSDGKHRLTEDRQQHDEADKNSEKNRLARELDRTKHGSHATNGDLG